jgi:hypothetical protein
MVTTERLSVAKKQQHFSNHFVRTLRGYEGKIVWQFVFCLNQFFGFSKVFGMNKRPLSCCRSSLAVV